MNENNKNDNIENNEYTGGANNASSDITEEKETFEDDVRDSKNCEEGGEDNLEIAEKEKQTNEVEEKGALQEEKGASEEEKNTDGEIQLKGEKTEEKKIYSSTYCPPYYVPNFSDTDGSTDDEDKGNEKKSKGAVKMIAVLCACGILLSFAVGSLGGFFAATLFDRYTENADVTIIRNDGTIKVKDEVGSTGYTEGDLTYSELYSLVSECVVDIVAEGSGSGSGVIISRANKKVYIVTNYHVISGAESVGIRFSGESGYRRAEVLGGSAAEDLAVLTVEVERDAEITCAIGGHIEDINIGDEVVAIGNPLGKLSGTMTNGIISSLERKITIDGNTMRFLQTNAEINSGNSGGGLFNMAGELIGIVNSKVSDDDTEGLGFAIPYDDTTVKYISEIIEFGYIRNRPSLGNIKVDTWYSKTGIYVTDGGNTVLENGDRVVSINSKEIMTKNDFNEAVKELQIGSTAEVVIERDGIRTHGTITVTEAKE